MKRIIEFELEDGDAVLMEVEDTEPAGRRRAGGTADDGEPSRVGLFKKAIAQVRPAAEMVVEAFREVNTPAEIGLEFALKFNTSVGLFMFASSDTEASFKVSLKWTNEPRPAAGTEASAAHSTVAETEVEAGES